MREGIVLGLAGFMQDLDRLKCEQEHFIEELKLAKEKVKENRLEKTLLENQSVVIDDLTAEVESLRTTNTDLENELKRVTLAHEEGARRLHGKVTMMEHEFTGRIARLERHVDEGCKTEKFDAHFKDIAQIVEDLKALKVNVEAQQSLFKEAVTQMQSRHENILRQMEENRQNSTKDLFKVIQEEDQRMCRLREELGLCGDLENKWRERIKDSLLGDMDESVLTAGIRRQLEETITALHATIKTLKRRSMTLEKENMRLQALLLRRDEESNLTNKIHLPNTSGNYGAYQ